MTHARHLMEAQSVLLTMIRISKYTVAETGVLPGNVLQTIHGLREYIDAVNENKSFVEKALKEDPPTHLHSFIFGMGLMQLFPNIKAWVMSWFD